MLDTILQELGIRPLINASATETPLGGSFMNAAVIGAMHEASQCYFDIRELHAAVSKKIAALTQNEDAMVSAGVASSFYLLTMALVKLKDPEFFEKIPEQLPVHESVIIYKSQHVEYLCGVQQAGVRLREIGEIGERKSSEAAELEAAIREERPLAFIYVNAGLWIPPGAPSLEEAVRVCKKYNVPVLVDGAAQLPPKSNLWNYTHAGADIAMFSGGKDLHGPCHMGLILGRKDIVSACRSLISPNEGVGRFFKIGKEELIAAFVAVQEYLNRNEDERRSWCERENEKLIQELSGIAGLTAEQVFPNEAGQPIPRVRITYDRTLYPVKPEDVRKSFLNGKIRIAFMLCPEKGFYFNPMTIKPGETEVIGAEIRSYFEGFAVRS